MSAKHTDPYSAVQKELDAAIAAKDPAAATGAVRRAQLELAKVALGPAFDPRRHRAASQALRELGRSGPATAPPTPLVTRGAR